jgi:hypothetical protein
VASPADAAVGVPERECVMLNGAIVVGALLVMSAWGGLAALVFLAVVGVVNEIV